MNYFFFNLVQIHNYIDFFFSLLKDQKKFESISLRTSAKFELVIIFVCRMYVCSAGSYNQTNICFSWSFNRGFFLMNNIMILMLMRVHGNFVQQVVTKFNELYQQTKICPGYLSSLPFELQSQINNLHLLLLPQKLLVHVCITLPFQRQ